MMAASFTAASSVWKALKDMIQGWNRFWFTPADTALNATILFSTG